MKPTHMIFKQRKNKNDISVEIGEDKLTYKIKDETVNRSEKVPYEDILSESYEFYESNKTFRNNAIYAGVVGILFLATNIVYGTRLWAWVFLIGCPIFYFLYSRSKVAFTVIKTTGDLNLFILQDKQHDQIVGEIYSSRNKYLKEQYLPINYSCDPQAELEKFGWLKVMGIITEREFTFIREEIEERN